MSTLLVWWWSPTGVVSLHRGSIDTLEDENSRTGIFYGFHTLRVFLSDELRHFAVSRAMLIGGHSGELPIVLLVPQRDPFRPRIENLHIAAACARCKNGEAPEEQAR
jgi:hypothetical protein